jgi:hypothetical protein
MVLTLTDDQVATITGFPDPCLFRFSAARHALTGAGLGQRRRPDRGLGRAAGVQAASDDSQGRALAKAVTHDQLSGGRCDTQPRPAGFSRDAGARAS